MAEPAGLGPVSHTATSELIPLVFDLFHEPLISSIESGPTDPARQFCHKNVNGYLRLRNGSRGRALRLCISPGYGAFITDEIFHHCHEIANKELNPIYQTFNQVKSESCRKPVQRRPAKPIRGSRSTGKTRCSIDIAMPTSTPTAFIGMRIHATMATSLEVNHGNVDMWIGTTAWHGTAHPWVEAINAGGDSDQQAITLLDNRNQRWPITIDLNEHPVFARERGATHPKTLQETLDEETREFKAKRAENGLKGLQAQREDRVLREELEQNAAPAVDGHLGVLSGRSEQPQRSTTELTGSSGYAMQGSGSHDDSRHSGTTSMHTVPQFASPMQPQFTTYRQEGHLQNVQPIGPTKDSAERSRNPGYARGPSHSSSTLIADQTTRASSLFSDLRLSGPVFSEPQSMEGESMPRRGTRRLFGDRESPEDHDPHEGEHEHEGSRRRGNPAKARKRSQERAQVRGQGSQNDPSTGSFHGPGKRSILNTPSPVASSSGNGRRHESQRDDERGTERQRQGSTRASRRRERSSSHEHDHDEDRRRPGPEQGRKDEASADRRKESGLFSMFSKPSRK